MAEEKPRFSWRPLVRSLHRDMGYLAVGLTLVYAISGLAVNHIADWDPNFRSFRATHELGGPLQGEDGAIAREVMGRLRIRGPAREVYRAAPDQLEIRLDQGALHVNPQTGRVVQEGQKPRPLLRLANWLHLNRGKKAWTVVADLYAVGLLFLAISGMFMLPGKKGMPGRGGILVGIGVAIPILYVVLSGGP
jgi:uncharacterized protein